MKKSSDSDVSKINYNPEKDEMIEYLKSENSAAVVYLDPKGELRRIIDLDLDGNVLFFRLFEDGVLVEARGFNSQGTWINFQYGNTKCLGEYMR